MQLERITSEGLAHNSYLIASGGDAVVIDPRRDIDAYLDLIAAGGLRLRHVLETHRNEDYLVGSAELGERTGADVWHADGGLDYRYGRAVEDGRRWQVGKLEIQALHTPGHTEGHTCYLLKSSQGEPWMLFSGDCLFAGDVGRTDLAGKDRLEEMTRKLYRSIQERILPLGDHVLLLPAHGAGSACGSAIADRPWTTLGLEKRLNPKLGLNEEEFVQRQAVLLEVPPYFTRMREGNLKPNGFAALPLPVPRRPDEFAAVADESGAVVVDTRMPAPFGGAHVPGSISIWKAGVGKYAGWYLPPDRPLLLVVDEGSLESVTRTLLRMGYDNIAGYLAGGMHAWYSAGKETEAIPMLAVQEAAERSRAESSHFLDVRSQRELDEVRLPQAQHIHVTQLPGRLEEVPGGRPVYVFCESGLRSTTAASLLAAKGWADVQVILGGMDGWQAAGLPVERPRG